jgi:ubiquinone/menaquinone biosynthesis C-methylase UbiE
MEKFQLSVKRFDEFASEYAEKFMDVEAYAPSIGRFCDLITDPDPAILELACGPGNVTRFVRNRFPNSRYLAIDLSPKMIELAKTRVPDVEFRVMDVRDISALITRFDAIMCSFCLPFLSSQDTNALIAHCSGSLKKNGVLYLSTMEGDESMAGYEPTNFSGEQKIYFNYHQQQDLENALTACGFVIDRITRQDYHEPDGRITTDMIFIAKKIPGKDKHQPV